MALAKIKYSFYISYTHQGLYKHGRHTRYVADILQDAERKHARGVGSQIIFTMPPRHSKSMTITETFPSYFIGRDPDRRVIEVSYGDTLARRFGRANLQKIERFGKDLFGITVDHRRSSVTDWDVEGHRGGMISRGIGGGITGEGADLLIIDDPIKNRREAESETYRNFIWEEWKSTLQTRLQPNAIVVIILTRWHEDDLVGRLLNPQTDGGSDPNDWTVINLPAIAEDDDPLEREEGEPLFPEIGFDKKWAEKKKREVGSVAWSSLYQQHPQPPEGRLFKRHYWNYYRKRPDRFDEMIQSWDCAFKDQQDNDYVVGQVWGRIQQDYYLLDQVRGKMGVQATMQAIRNLTEKWPKAYAKLIEDKANGPAVIELLKNEIAGIIPVNPEGGKVARANAVSPLIESGNVYIPHPSLANWISDYVEELASFPNGAHDDQVDSTTQALHRLHNQASSVLIGRA